MKHILSLGLLLSFGSIHAAPSPANEVGCIFKSRYDGPSYDRHKDENYERMGIYKISDARLEGCPTAILDGNGKVLSLEKIDKDPAAPCIYYQSTELMVSGSMAIFNANEMPDGHAIRILRCNKK
jgi:hypothetical protein